MSNITLDLSNEERFETNTFTIDKNITFIFGKNGTGKTTLTNLLKDNATDYEVSVFQGFETVVSESNMLDAVILGKDNVEIDKKIAEKNAEIDKIQLDIAELETNVTKQPGKPNNLWARHQKKEVKFKKQKDKIEEFYKGSAAKIKNETDPQIAKTTYYKNDFETELKKAKFLSDIEIEQMKKTVNLTEKKASYLPVLSLNLGEYLKEMNELLCRKVSAQVVIEEFANNKDKETFAESGFKLHKANDKCSFCGNVLSKERYDKLKLYFSADEVESFRTELLEFISKIESELKKIKDIDIDVNSFYPEKSIEAENLRSNLLERKTELDSFLNELKETANHKQKYLYESLELLDISIPESMDLIIQKYNTLVTENNSNSLSEQKEIAKTKLRCHIIKTLLEEFGYEAEIVRKEELEKAVRESNNDLEGELKAIQLRKKEVSEKEDEIKELVRSTKNEKILADEINRKLKLYVNFELVHMQDKDEKGFYQIKCKRTGDIRNVDELSTGEKNIIAFLYFLEKLKEVKVGNSKPKLIIFDDPMNSNDDTMQYVIIEELQKLMRRVKKDDKFVLLTHNNHFYLNVKYGFDRDEGYGKNTFMRFNYNGHNIEFKPIQTKNEDFKTNYDAFWKELEFLYDSQDASAAMLLNPCRRITETFIKFNCLKLEGMLGTVTGAQKMFNVNSHSIDDLEADLNGMEKIDIIKMLQECFKGVNAEEHFKKHCKIEIV